MRHPWYSLLRRLAPPARTRRPRRRPALCLEVLEDRCTPTTPGSLDTTFGGDGKVMTGFGPNTNALGSAVAVQADGKIVVGGTVFTSGVGNDFTLTRYNPDGSLDTSFDADGRVPLDFGGTNDALTDLAIQPDGKIIAVGTVNAGNTFRIGLARLNPNGSLDGNFSSSIGVPGLTVIDYGANEVAQAVALQKDGKIVVAGSRNGLDFAVVRLNTNGVVDSNFGVLGVAIIDVSFGGGSTDQAYEVAIQEDGRIVVAGETNVFTTKDFALARLTTEGTLDPSFGSFGLGVEVTDFGNTVDSLSGGIGIQEDGKIVVGGSTANLLNDNDFALARYDPNGTLDGNFDGDGKVTTDFGNFFDLATDLVIQPDGKILLGGYSGLKADFALARYDPNGSLDTTFDGDGRVTTPFGTTPEASADIASALALQSNGRVVLVGTTTATATGLGEFALARYLVPPEVTIEDVSVTEGDGVARFTVSLSFAISEPVRISYATADDSAKAGSDYQQTQGTLVAVVKAGDPSGNIDVPIIDDNTDEETETFLLNLMDPTENGFLIDNQATATIEDNDAMPTLSIDDVSVNEGDGTATFTLSLSNPSGKPITVDFATADGTMSPAAKAGEDYVQNQGQVTINPEATSGKINVTLIDDDVDEFAETFLVNLSNPTNATIADNQAKGTITDNDPLPSLSINDVTVNEGSGTATFTVSLTGQTEKMVTVAYATANGSATAGNDYTQKSGTLTFNPGTPSQPITVPILDDTIYEGTEQFFVNLSNPTNATIADGQGQAAINDNEPAPTLAIDDVTVSEGDGIATFTVKLTGATSTTATVDVVTVDGSATGGQDFTQTSKTLTFDASTTVRTVTVPILEDDVDEDDEVFFAELRNPTNAALQDGQGKGTITDNDPSPSLFINDIVVHEDDGTATFTVSLAGRTAREVTVDFTNAPGTTNPATPDVDFVQSQGRLTFSPGVTFGTINVTLIDDNTDEVDETFLVNLSNPVNATIADNQAEGTIVDNDGPPALSVADVEVPEGGSAIFTVSLSHPSSRTVTVEARTANTTPNASAVGGQDYSPVTTTLTFDPGTLSRNLTVETLDDATDEDVERFLVDLTNPANATIADGQAVGTITDNDPLPTLSVNDVTVDEAARAATFTVSLTGQTAKVVQVDFVVGVNPGAPSALPGEDFVQTSGTLRFDPGTTSRTITVEILDDDVHEGEETFLVNLLSPSNATLDDGSGVGTITDNDPPSTVTVAADDPLARETTGGTDNGVFTLTRENDLNQALTVNYRLSGTATNGADYATLSGSVEFSAGEEAVSVTLVPVDDQTFEGNETVILILLPSGDYLIGESKEATVVLRDNELRAEGQDITPAVGSPDPVTVARFVSADSTAPVEQFSATITFEDGSTAEGTITQPDGPGTQFVVMTDRAFPTKSTALTGTFPVQTRITDTAGGTSVDVEGVATVQEDFPPEVDTPSKRLVFEWFKLLLNRPPTDGELTFLSERLDAGLPPERAVSMIQASAEYASNLVFRAYHEWLHRDPEPGGFTNWHNALMNQPGFTYRELEVAIILSPEFASQGATAGSDALGLLYARGLNRSIGQGDLSFWGARLFMGTSDLEEVARSVLSSQERGVVILSADPSLERPLLGLYQVIVERNADEDGLGLLADFFTDGADLPAVVRLMATSGEFILANGGLP